MFVTTVSSQLTAVIVTLAISISARQTSGQSIIEAIRIGDSVAVHDMLDRGANIDFLYKDPKLVRHQTLLYSVADVGNEAIVALLLSKGANPNIESTNGWSPLHVAAAGGFADVAKLLLDHGASIDKGDGNNMSALVGAATEGHLEVVNLLIQEGADINFDRCGWTSPLHGAAKEGHLEVVNLLIQSGADVSNRGKVSPLHSAVFRNHLQVIKTLVENGADVNARCQGRTPLNALSMTADPRVVTYLLDHGADPLAKDEEGRTPLHEAVMYASAEVVAVLLPVSDLTAKDNFNLTPAEVIGKDTKDGVAEAIRNALSQKTVELSTNAIAKAQSVLVALGHDVGNPDGVLGSRTAKAIEAFQRDASLPVTGRLDFNTMASLMPERDQLIDETAGYVDDGSPCNDEIRGFRLSIEGTPPKGDGVITISSDGNDCTSINLMVNVTVHGYSEEYINVPFEVFYDGTVHEFVGLICFAAPGERYSGTSSFLNTDGGAVRFVDGKPVRSGDITFSGWVDARLRPTRSYFAIDSDPDDPLTFILTVGGYRYLYGSGTLRTPGGRLYVFRPVDTTDNAPND